MIVVEVAKRVSKLVKSCDLSKAIIPAYERAPPAITSALTKYAHDTQQHNHSTECRIQHVAFVMHPFLTALELNACESPHIVI